MWIFHLEIGRKKFEISHHKVETDESIRKARLQLKKKCLICDKKIDSLYKRNYCSAICQHEGGIKHKREARLAIKQKKQLEGA